MFPMHIHSAIIKLPSHRRTWWYIPFVLCTEWRVTVCEGVFVVVFRSY